MDLNFKNDLNILLANSVQDDNILNSQIKRYIQSYLIKKRCQHIVWHLLHSFSVFYPENPTEIQKQNTKELLINIKRYMPFCMSCSNNNSDKFVENLDIDLVVSKNNELISFLIDYHKYINTNLVKNKNYDSSIYTNDFIINKYSDGKYQNYITNTYNIISFTEIINANNTNLKHNMDNLLSNVQKEINSIEYQVILNVIINQ